MMWSRCSDFKAGQVWPEGLLRELLENAAVSAARSEG